jgi:hypothetical protein
MAGRILVERLELAGWQKRAIRQNNAPVAPMGRAARTSTKQRHWQGYTPASAEDPIEGIK